MTWLQFVASIVGSLAWPSVLLVLLVLLRTQLIQLVARITEVTLPGGWKASFDRNLQEGRAQADLLLGFFETPDISPLETEETQGKLSTTRIPVLLVMTQYDVLLTEIRNAQQRLGLTKASPEAILSILISRKLLPDHAGQLFNNLKKARNAAIHSSEEITRGEAADFTLQAELLAKMVEDATRKL